ncbi:DNA polymerase/3'-5' exonuclease PolX [Chitinispirillales bacterium ANBcel5]|uniref:DNA polymerase/3'-5' exonuclease PolX n=1 Tax=Cellulosispirillum alkaliphilum TaxID=3039283 RepID=UPI002A5663AE|nr:DNA polymerase/3'-5' exonuclease PolX [Chitinispirillales bacterium ANBcel5]
MNRIQKNNQLTKQNETIAGESLRVHNSAIADMFYEYADLLQIRNENAFKIRAYRNAARTITSLPGDIHESVENGEDLSQLPGIGKDLASKIAQIAKTGRFDELEKLRETMSPELSKLMQIEGLGGRRVGVLYRDLGIDSIEKLERAAKEHKIASLRGFGAKTEKAILENIEKSRRYVKGILLSEAQEIASLFTRYMRESEYCDTVVVAGSFRRRKETVRDLDILVTSSYPREVTDHFCNYPFAMKVSSRGPTRSSVALRNGFKVDLRVVPQESFGAALHYFTGSQAHNIAVRKRGGKRGLKISEYGVFREEKRVAGRTEQEVFNAVGLPYIEPELREDRGEIDAALERKLPKLVKRNDILGDLHTHTNYTDGVASIEQMVEAAKKRGYNYVAVTDHSKRIAMAHGLDESALRGQMERIDLLNEQVKPFTILKGIEVDILEDGTLDLPDSVLRELDVVVCSVHSKFSLSPQKQTERIIRAMDNPWFSIFAHPTGRLINKRPPMQYDVEKVCKAASQRGCFIEINSSPERLDANDLFCMTARTFGIPVVISSDAHRESDLDNIAFGLDMARRGWVEKGEVLNCLSVKSLKARLKRG